MKPGYEKLREKVVTKWCPVQALITAGDASDTVLENVKQAKMAHNEKTSFL